MDFSTLRDEAKRRDRHDPLSEFRDEFVFPTGPEGDRAVYFCGNSLGLQPRRAREIVGREMDEWAEMAVDGHFDGEQAWSSYHDNLAGPMSRIVGASKEEVVVMNTLTANLHFMLVSFYRPDDERYKIIMEGGAFPSDEYAFKSQARFHGYDPDDAVVHVQPRDGEATLRTEDILQTIEDHGDETALVCLSGLQYYTGQIFDMQTITEKAREAGAKVGWDLAHAVGNAELNLHDWGPDFAVWCTYKYLNGGPGSVAGCFVHQRWSEAFDLPRFAGWWGNKPETRFDMKPEFDPAAGAAGWQVSNAPILSMAPLEASLELFDRAGMDNLREKSKDLTGWMLELIDRMPDQPFEIITPREPSARGCQLSIRTPVEQGDEGARSLYQTLRDGGVVCDYREPRVIRVAPTPMYNSYMDVWRFCRILYEFVDG